jgi:hypothetical protein
MLAVRAVMSLLLGRERLEQSRLTGKFACPLAALEHAGQSENMNGVVGELRLAVLIDGENVPAKDAGALFAQVAKLGNPIVRRVYGDFTKQGAKDWPKAINQHGGDAVQSGHTSAGKNASDIALVVDAMDFLHKRSVDGYCIVSADGDFTRLAKRAREDGFKVFCFAHSNAAKALKAACDAFFPLATASPTPVTPKQSASPPAKSKTAQPTPVRQPKLAIPWLQDAVPADAQWITFSALGTALRAKEPAYLKKTGYASLKKLLTALKDRYEHGVAADGKTAQVRRRP